MASRRALKRSINQLTFELVSECYTYKLFHPEKTHEKTNQAMQNIVQLRNSLVKKVNNPIDKVNPKNNKAHYNGIVKELRGMLSLMDQIG